MMLSKKLNVLLVSPPVYFEEDKGSQIFKINPKKMGQGIPVGLMYLAGELIKNNINVKI